MSDTASNTAIPPQIWVDLYAASGIDVGDQLIVQNIGVCDIYLTTAATQPVDDTAMQILERGRSMVNDIADTGAWAFCAAGGAVSIKKYML